MFGKQVSGARGEDRDMHARGGSEFINSLPSHSPFLLSLSRLEISGGEKWQGGVV